jgi:hypothetical protein
MSVTADPQHHTQFTAPRTAPNNTATTPNVFTRPLPCLVVKLQPARKPWARRFAARKSYTQRRLWGEERGSGTGSYCCVAARSTRRGWMPTTLVSARTRGWRGWDADAGRTAVVG